jgi:hypothetical protein
LIAILIGSVDSGTVPAPAGAARPSVAASPTPMAPTVAEIESLLRQAIRKAR